jgi:endonuclease-3
MKPEAIEPFFATLAAANPRPQSELQYTSVFELLAAVLLSAQATDVSVNKATRELFALAPTPQKMLDLGLERVTAQIRTIGLFRTKAANLLQHLPHPGTISTRPGAAFARGAGSLARRGPQDGQRGAQCGLWRAHHGRGHTRVPRQQPHWPGARPQPAGSGNRRCCGACRQPTAWTRTTGLILHGRYVCTARAPQCSACAVRNWCDQGRKLARRVPTMPPRETP